MAALDICYNNSMSIARSLKKKMPGERGGKRQALEYAFEWQFDGLISCLKAFGNYLDLGGRVPDPEWDSDWHDDEVVHTHYDTLDDLEIAHGIDIQEPLGESEVAVEDNQILNYISFIRTAEERLGSLTGLAKAISIESGAFWDLGDEAIDELRKRLDSFTIEVYKRVLEGGQMRTMMLRPIPSERRCAYCHDAFRPGEDLRSCEECGTMRHEVCIAESEEACPTFGCPMSDS